MSFLVPAAWSALFLALPVLVFYLIRQRSRERPVSTLLFWRQVSPQLHNRPFWRRFRNWFSYLLQVLFILLLAFALAHPVARDDASEARRVLLILDTTVSMGTLSAGGTAFENARAALRERIAGLRGRDRAMLVLAGPELGIAGSWTRHRSHLTELVDAASLSTAEGSPEDALRLARNLARTHDRLEAHFFTDDPAIPEGSAAAFDRLRVHAFPRTGANAGIVRFAARRESGAPGLHRLGIAVRQTAPADGDLTVRLRRNGELVDVRNVVPDDDGAWEYSWDLRGSDAIRYEAELVVPEGDALAADNRAALALPPLRMVRVAFLGPRDPFVEAALASLPLVEPVAIGPGNPAPDLLISNGMAPPASVEAPLTILVNPTASGFWGTAQGALSDPLVARVAEEHPLMRFVRLADVRLESGTRFAPPADATVLVEGIDAPLIYGDLESDRPYLVAAFPFAAGDLPYRTAFPILIGNVIQWLRPIESGIVADLPGPAATRAPASMDTAAEGDRPSPAPLGGPVSGLPIWWFAAVAGVCWALGEYFLFSRKVTE